MKSVRDVHVVQAMKDWEGEDGVSSQGIHHLDVPGRKIGSMVRINGL